MPMPQGFERPPDAGKPAFGMEDDRADIQPSGDCKNRHHNEDPDVELAPVPRLAVVVLFLASKFPNRFDLRLKGFDHGLRVGRNRALRSPAGPMILDVIHLSVLPWRWKSSLFATRMITRRTQGVNRGAG